MKTPCSGGEDESPWKVLIDRRREEIERDNRELTKGQLRRAKALYASSEDEEEESSEGIVDGRLDLRGQGLTKCVVPQRFDARHIESLVLRGNNIRVLEPRLLSALLSLRYLDVSENALERLNFPCRVTVLLASRNQIVRLTADSQNLRKLDVSRNFIRFVGTLQAPRLQEVDLRHNDLFDNNFLALAQLRALRCLLLNGNPIVKDPRYKLKLFAKAPHLRDALGADRCVFVSGV